MTLAELVAKNRSRRRFDARAAVSEETLKELAELARLCPSTANGQALRFHPVFRKEDCEKVYPTLMWAGALPDWDGPDEAERPTAYMIILCDQKIAKTRPTDVGICAQTMMLGAVDRGLGGCMIASVRKEALAEALGIDQERYSIELVLALGKPVEDVRIVDVPADGNVKYYRDAAGVHYVPKRSLEDLLV